MQKLIKCLLLSLGSGKSNTPPSATTSVSSNSSREGKCTTNYNTCDDSSDSSSGHATFDDTTSVGGRNSNKTPSDGSFDMDMCFEVGYNSSQRVVSKLLQALKVEQKNQIRPPDRLRMHVEWNTLIEDMLVHDISKHYPTHHFLTKNSHKNREEVRLTDEPTWFIDPLGCARNFSHGFPFSNINLAFWMAKKPHFGIIWNPLQDVCYTARDDFGAYMNVEPLQVSKCTRLEDALVMYESKTKSLFEPTEMARHKTIARHVDAVRSLGSNSLSMCMVAQGFADAYIDFNCTSWDMSAAILLVKEAGGVVWDPSLKPFDLMSRRVLCAATQELAEKLSALVTDRTGSPRGEPNNMSEVWDLTFQKLAVCINKDDKANKKGKKADEAQDVRSPKKKCKRTESEDESNEVLSVKVDQQIPKVRDSKKFSEVWGETVQRLGLLKKMNGQEVSSPYKKWKQTVEPNDVLDVIADQDAPKAGDSKEISEVWNGTVEKLDLYEKWEDKAKDRESGKLQSARPMKTDRKRTRPKVVYVMPNLAEQFISPSTKFSGYPKAPTKKGKSAGNCYPTDPILPGQNNIF